MLGAVPVWKACATKERTNCCAPALLAKLRLPTLAPLEDALKTSCKFVQLPGAMLVLPSVAWKSPIICGLPTHSAVPPRLVRTRLFVTATLLTVLKERVPPLGTFVPESSTPRSGTPRLVLPQAMETQFVQ